jgi:acyl-coenzyme A synthetase/AMP-(fatty) acid ligase
MKYDPKTVTITTNDLKIWSKTFENKVLDLDEDDRVLVPGLCVWSYAHQDYGNWVAASINIRFSKPIYTNETMYITCEVLKKTDCYCHRVLTITVNDEIRQRAELKCIDPKEEL